MDKVNAVEKNKAVNSFQLEIGGIPILIKSEESSFMSLIADKYQAFAAPISYLTSKENALSVSQPDPPIKLHMNIRQVEKQKQPDMLEEELWINVSYRDDRFFIQRPDLEGEIDVSGRVARVTNRAAVYSFDSFLRILYSLILVQEGGFLLHAASVVKHGRGYIFMGRSGAGKSTIAGYSTQYEVLSDEISLIKKVGDQYLLYSTPFWGEQEIKGGNFYSPIHGIYQLKASPIYQLKASPETEIRKLQTKESLCRLMENILYFARVPFLTRQVFQNCLDFIYKTNLYELTFQKNNHFWEIIE